jgi:Zn-dependent metalloprotease
MKPRAAVLSALAVAGLVSVPALQATAQPAAPAAPATPRITTTSALAATRTNAVNRALTAIAKAPALAAFGSGQAFTAKDVLVDSDGTTHVRLNRTYAGLRVLGGDAVVHQTASGQITDVSRTLPRALSLSITPAIAATTAELLGVRPGAKLASPVSLVIDAIGGTPRLAYEVVSTSTQTDGTPSELHTYLDAANGKVLRREEHLETVGGDGQSLYSGTVGVQTTAVSGGYQLTDPTRGGGYTTDAQDKTDFCLGSLCLITAPSVAFKDGDNHWGNGTNTDRSTAAIDAHYGASQTWDFYKNNFGRNGIFNDGKGVQSRVHYGSNYVNAYWDGSKMTYGDGDGVAAGPLVSLDIAAHEMSHGVTSATANLTYSGESGGLNEANSDMFGTAVEFAANNGTDVGDYLIGERAFKDRPALRYLDKPSKDGKSADCWSSTVGNLDVHYSSGVGNHWYYLASEGSGAKTINGVSYNSPTCNGATFGGIGRDTVNKIWYRTLTVYLTSSSNYAAARVGSIRAATDLYGAGSAQVAGVAAAWSGVNVN